MKTKKIFCCITFLLLPFFNELQAEGSSIEAQMLAIDISNQLRPPEELANQLDNDLALIRSAFPEVVFIYYLYPYSPDELIVGLTDAAMVQYQTGQYHELDALNLEYGVINIRSGSRYIILTFNQVYNMELLADIYEQANAEGVRYAEPNYTFGDGSTIIAHPPFYTFVEAWGDCPSGCIFHEYYYFIVEDGIPSSVQYPGLALVSPNGRETLVAGTMHEIKWSSLDFSPLLLIEYTDDGTNWHQVDTVSFTMSYQWQVPVTNSQFCRVRVTDQIYNCTDASSSDFTIYECSQSLITDFNGDCVTDLADFVFFTSQWMDCGNPFDPNCLQ